MERGKKSPCDDLYDWTGPRLKTLLPVIKDTNVSKENFLKMIYAADADAEEQMLQNDYLGASRSYSFAIVAAQKMVLEPGMVETMLKRMRSYGDCMLKMASWLEAFNNAVEMTELHPGYAQAYLQMYKALVGEKNYSFAASSLLKGMVKCSLSNDESVTFILEASEVLGLLKLQMIDNIQQDPEAKNISQYRPSLPVSSSVWNRIVSALLEQKKYAALAFLTVGFGRGPDISALDGKCPKEVDCSSANIDDLFKTLSHIERIRWGDKLAEFILERSTTTGKNVTNPLGVQLARSALQQQSSKIFEEIVKKHGVDHLSPENADSSGDTVFHVLVKSSMKRLNMDLIDLLMNHGAVPCVRDASGKLPHEYVPIRFKQNQFFHRMSRSQQQPEEGFTKRIERLKNEGNLAYKNKQSDLAKARYLAAIEAIKKSPYQPASYPNLRRDLAVLYNNMAAVCASVGDQAGTIANATKSAEIDATYHKPYWRLGKSLLDQKKFKEACERFLHGMGCEEVDEDQNMQFVLEICCMLPSLSVNEAEHAVKEMLPKLTPIWPKVVENLSKNKAWDSINRLVLGPPKKAVDKSVVPAEWHYADSYEEGKKIKVGYAMTLKASTPVLSTLLEQVDNHELTGNIAWVPDLVLALVLQGASLHSLPQSDEETCYHSAVYLCCVTEKLGLLKYIMSEEPHASAAKLAINRERRTILHSACLYFCDGVNAMGQQVVRLLLDKGMNPGVADFREKKAVDYVAPRSPIYQLLLKPPAPNPKTVDEMKEQGNVEFKKGNFKTAMEFYSQAITLMQKKLTPAVLLKKGNEEKKHELAVLFSNRAECHLKMNNVEEAFNDAKECVAIDGDWYRGHLRVGRALVRKEKIPLAIKAFSNAFNTLGLDATDIQKKEVLKEIVKTVTTYMSDVQYRIPNLGYVDCDLWAKVAYDFFCNASAMTNVEREKAEYKAAVYALSQFNPLQMTKPGIILDLRPLLSWNMVTNQDYMPHLSDLIMFLIESGSDPRRLTLYEGDTFLHAVCIFTIFAGGEPILLDYLMKTKVKPERAENMQDLDGNTVLHLFAMPINYRIPFPIHPINREHILQILVQYGINPLVKNRLDQTALECVLPAEKNIYGILEKASRKAPAPNIPTNRPSATTKPATPTKATTSAKPAATTTTKQTQDSNKDSTSAQSRKGENGASKRDDSKSRGDVKPDKDKERVKKTDSKGDKDKERVKKTDSRGWQPQCNQCEANVREAKQHFASSNEKVGYSKLINVLSITHQRDERHSKFVSESLDMIVSELGKSLTPDVPDVLLKMSQGQLHQVLETLASLDKWRQLEVLVDKCKANDVPRGNFACKLSVLALLRDKGLCGAETQRLQILKLLTQHGAQLPEEQHRACMEVAVDHREFRIVEYLVDLGVPAKFFSLETGDTPLHAALTIALDKDKGNSFSLLEKLIALCETDQDKHPDLNLAQVDSRGNSLLHAACCAAYSKHSHRAVELLVARDVPVDLRNREGRTALDYLKPHDRRTQYLRVAGRQASGKKEGRSQSQGSVVPGVKMGRLGDGGDNEEGLARAKQAKPEIDKPAVDTRSLKTKDTVSLLNTLVDELSELTPAEARLAKTAKGKWLEMERAPQAEREEVVYSDNEDDKAEEDSESTVLPLGTGKMAPPEEPAEEDAEEGEEIDAEEDKGEDNSEDDPDFMTFDNLEWEVECTAEVWKTLRDQNITVDVKKRIVRSIKFLASGEWRPQLCRKVRHVPDTINLFQAKFVKGARILWELAIAFSPRLSDAAEKRINEEERKAELAVRGGRIYTEIIRVWDIVLQYDKLKPAIKKIIQSHERGEHCLIRKELKGVKSQQFQGSSVNKRYPVLYSEADMNSQIRDELQRKEEAGRMKLYPPASASEMEFHILKFYCFSSALVYNILKNLEMKIDFPFRVTDREHAVINLQSQAPILLLGRSGTGKTTCCLYRLWSRFITYWTKSKDMDYAAWLPRTIQYAEEASETAGQDEEDDDEENEGGACKGSDRQKVAHKEEATAALSNAAEETKQRTDSFFPLHGAEECEEEETEEGEEENEGFSSVHYDHLHQLFVTKNQVLCSEVQKNFRELCHADEVAKHHVSVEENSLPHKLQQVDEYKYPLFLTSRQLLLMLDASLDPVPDWPRFFDRNEDGSLKVTIEGWGADEEIFAFVPLEDDSDEEKEEYFEEGDAGEGKDKVGQAVDNSPKQKDSRREVTYEIFAHEIWPKITKKSQVSYHPSLVWTEIMSFIKGSFASLTQRRGYLDRESYEQLGRKQAPNFSGNRDKVYELFLKYNDYKRQHGMYDEADLVFNIFQRLRLAGPVPWILHEVFVDETQDFTQAELTVLIRLAHSPNDMFLTGDTAQSIMRGVSFRFSDLKTLFHYAKQSLRARGKTGMLEVPRQVYQLTHNYRSHAGILSLASAVIDLLVEFFPESFDRLEKDQGLFDGPQPVVLASGSPADLAILLSGNKRKTSHIEFGAHQVILVASEEARNNLPEELGLGLVLTIYEAKGLEFDDVLLYNFFTDSQASKEWRVVTDFLERLSKQEASVTQTAMASTSGLVEIDEDVLHQPGRPRALAFDPNQHKILNSELKHLYTALTRARVNVWIFDQNEEKRAPMFEYFKARKLVRVVSIAEGSQGVSQSMFAEKSSPKEWEKRGDEIMQRSLYDVAAKCYTMAGATHKHNIAVAHHKALKASHLRSQPRAMREAFLQAAVLFLQCHHDLVPSAATLALRFNLVLKAGRCLQNARENHLAALVFDKNGQPELAAPLYLRAHRWIEASQCYEQVDNFGRAVKILDEQELYDQAIDCLQRYHIRKQDFERKNLPVPKALIDHKPEAAYTVASLSYKAATFYRRQNQQQKMLAAIERLPNKEDQIKFMQKHGLLLEAAQLMCQEGRIGEAARMMLYNGKVDKAMKIAEEGSDCALKAQCCWLKAQQLLAEARKSPKVQKKGGRSKADKDKEKVEESSDEENSIDDSTKLKVTELLERARQQYDLCHDNTGIGECQLTLALIQRDQQLLEMAFKSFSTAQPVSNIAGMLECVEALLKMSGGGNVDFKNCRKLIWGVEKVFEAVQILLHPSSPEDRNRYQLYLSFYGLEKSSDGKLVLHPKLKPRCIRMIGIDKIFSSKEERKEERLYHSATDVCNHLATSLILRTKAWCEEVDFNLNNLLPKVTQCHSFQEGVDCEDLDMCPFLHDAYSEELSRQAVDVLSNRVRLDHALQSAVEQLKTIDIPLSELTLNLMVQEHLWKSVEMLLDFIFPAGLLTYHVMTIIRFCTTGLTGPEHHNAGVRHQLQRYLQYEWDNPGRVGKGKSTNVLKERCKSTHWVLLASLLVPIFKLDIQVDENCTKTERELMIQKPRWIKKKHKYALLYESNVVIFLARRHLDALKFLKPDNFDPFEALIKFTKFVKLLADRGKVRLMPELPILLYWMEVFTTIALILAIRLRGSGTLVLPSCYPRVLHLFNLTMPKGTNITELLDKHQFSRSQNIALLHQRIQSLMLLLCSGPQSRFCLLSHLVTAVKKRATYHLLTERVLVLTLTLLLNIEQQHSPREMEATTLRCIHNVSEDQLQVLPPRLATLIDRVQAATSYGGIIKALDTTLREQGEHIQFCQWRFSANNLSGFVQLDPAKVRAGGPFLQFSPEQLYGASGMETFQHAVDDIDEGAELGLMGEEEEISPEEKEQALAKVNEAEQKERFMNFGRKILRFFRNVILKKRMLKARLHCIHRIGYELFMPFMQTEKMCGACGVGFDKVEGVIGQGETMEEDEEEMMARQKHAHLTSDQHRYMYNEFMALCQVYYGVVRVPLIEINAFFSKMEVKKRKDTWYKGLEFYVNGVLQRYEALQNKLDLIIQERRWTERQRLVELCHEVDKFVKENNVRRVVEQNFYMHQENQKQVAAHKEAERQHQEKMADGFVDDQIMEEYQDVVDRPMQMGPNANFAGRGGGRGRGRGRGYGQVKPRNRTYNDDTFVQFAQGDLPPRFRRQQQH